MVLDFQDGIDHLVSLYNSARERIEELENEVNDLEYQVGDLDNEVCQLQDRIEELESLDG